MNQRHTAERSLGVSYDLAFWEGPRPQGDEEASEVFDETWDALEGSEDVVSPHASHSGAHPRVGVALAWR
jgi:hypothetical protein